MTEYDFVDPDLPEKREVQSAMEGAAEEGTLFGVTNYPEMKNRAMVVNDTAAEDEEPLGKLCAGSEQVEGFDMEERYPEQTEGYSDKVAGSYQQQSFISRCLNKLGELL